MRYTNKTLTIVATMGFFAVLATNVANAGTIYVDDNATGANNGMSWADAFTELQSALAVATSGDEIWVAAGTYTPDYDVNTGMHTGDRIATFQLKNGVAIYGGLAGDEDPATFNLDDRDFVANETILSGDLNGDDAEVSDPMDLLTEPTRAENSNHVVTGGGTDGTAILDGFTITAGNAVSFYPHYRGGGGMYNDNGNPTLTNCTISGNSSSYDGGGMYNDNGNPTLTNCSFSGNSSKHYGGGMSNNYDSSPTLTNCSFSGNSAEYAGGMCKWSSRTTLTNCILWGNTATFGSQIYRLALVSYSCIQDDDPDDGNV
ncbi:MAG: right-handed parallel beta-helix repeat-containing protein, partial [Planctomycetota bacterium]